ncbi:MAG: hypothetical protein OXD49_10805 [Candidatus Poribacteria bacterium]|nr:hypothetical protein [Candidatus Poribacteria bacterium]
MPPSFSEYLFPENPIAFSIIAFLIGFFSVWCIGLIRYWRWLLGERKQIENNQNIQPLVDAQQKRTPERENSDPKAGAEEAFHEFCEERSLGKRSPITKHLQAIFLAGWEESRLEVGELINHTTSILFRWNNLFRSVLAVFIVIGLLGTLFGLADSLTKLSPALKESMANEASIEKNEASTANETATENSEKMTQALGGLLDKMKGALAPSIWGIIFTIVGVIFFGIYQQACHPVKSTLERLTLTVWVPQLYPTTSQKLSQTLQQSESQMQKGFETAAQFSESVQKVQDNISEFNESLTQARAITQPLSNSVTQINKAASDISTAADTLNIGFTENLNTFSKEFTSSVTHLTGFQDEIRNLHQQFQDTANQKLNQFQEAANKKLDQQIETLNKQDQNLTTTVEVLKNSEKLYVESCQQIDNTLQKFLKKTAEASTNIETTNKKFLEGINTSNREWIKEIQTQLKADLAIIQPTLKEELKTLTKQLTTDLKEVQRTQDEGLKALTKQLNLFQLPIEKTADQIEGTIESFTRIMEGIVKNLQSEFQKQNKTIKEQNEKYEAQLTSVKELNESVENLLTQLDESSNSQSAAVSVLSSKVEGLTENTQDLAAAITSFTSDSGDLSHSVAEIEKHAGTLGTASQQFVEKVERADVTPLNVNIERLNTIIGDISQNSQTLAITVNQLARQINSSGTGESGHRRKKRSLLSKLNPFSREEKDGR